MSAKTKLKALPLKRFIARHLDWPSVDAILEETMRSFDTACLKRHQDLQPLEIKALRENSTLASRFRSVPEYQRINGFKSGKSGASVPAGCH